VKELLIFTVLFSRFSIKLNIRVYEASNSFVCL
jgi:hypothetical protein